MAATAQPSAAQAWKGSQPPHEDGFRQELLDQLGEAPPTLAPGEPSSPDAATLRRVKRTQASQQGQAMATATPPFAKTAREGTQPPHEHGFLQELLDEIGEGMSPTLAPEEPSSPDAAQLRRVKRAQGSSQGQAMPAAATQGDGFRQEVLDQFDEGLSPTLAPEEPSSPDAATMRRVKRAQASQQGHATQAAAPPSAQEAWKATQLPQENGFRQEMLDQFDEGLSPTLAPEEPSSPDAATMRRVKRAQASQQGHAMQAAAPPSAQEAWKATQLPQENGFRQEMLDQFDVGLSPTLAPEEPSSPDAATMRRVKRAQASQQGHAMQAAAPPSAQEAWKATQLPQENGLRQEMLDQFDEGLSPTLAPEEPSSPDAATMRRVKRAQASQQGHATPAATVPRVDVALEGPPEDIGMRQEDLDQIGVTESLPAARVPEEPFSPDAAQMLRAKRAHDSHQGHATRPAAQPRAAQGAPQQSLSPFSRARAGAPRAGTPPGEDLSPFSRARAGGPAAPLGLTVAAPLVPWPASGSRAEDLSPFSRARARARGGAPPCGGWPGAAGAPRAAGQPRQPPGGGGMSQRELDGLDTCGPQTGKPQDDRGPRDEPSSPDAAQMRRVKRAAQAQSGGVGRAW
ncbi:unnamed protein product [Prorocentrum cordatum]|uniref:Uncharacterized protein n=1 Tax=Prorocentrum cordatum TaxID=2364126 RepID=A0ABN9Q6Q4_9DINO|nr:unnamed protein product [Polarella glacialis]